MSAFDPKRTSLLFVRTRVKSVFLTQRCPILFILFLYLRSITAPCCYGGRCNDHLLFGTPIWPVSSSWPTLGRTRRGCNTVGMRCTTGNSGYDQRQHDATGVTSGQCSLQEAIYASEFKSNTAVQSTNPDVTYTTKCTAGTGDDTIVLPPGAVFTFDHFWDGDSHNIFGPTATPIISSKITIEGNGATLQWENRWSPGNSRLFAIGTVNDENFPSGTGDLTLKNVYIKNFHIKGGNGGDGGGGGLGAGGAIYNEGNLTVENSTFENNGAVGGRGHFGFQGGGGGLSGDGGNGCIHSAGGGGGSRGNGGNGAVSACGASASGGGGGGTVLSGAQGSGVSTSSSGGVGGFRCGGSGADAGDDADNAPCLGGGGGGAGGSDHQLCGSLAPALTRVAMVNSVAVAVVVQVMAGMADSAAAAAAPGIVTLLLLGRLEGTEVLEGAVVLVAIVSLLTRAKAAISAAERTTSTAAGAGH